MASTKKRVLLASLMIALCASGAQSAPVVSAPVDSSVDDSVASEFGEQGTCTPVRGVPSSLPPLGWRQDTQDPILMRASSVTRGSTYKLEWPALAWPVPKPNVLGNVTRAISVDPSRNTMGGIRAALEERLSGGGYARRARFAVAGGFAMITPLERIDEFGRPAAGGARWAKGKEPCKTFSFFSEDYWRMLLTGDNGRYRVMLIIVADSVEAANYAPSEVDVERWEQSQEADLNDGASFWNREGKPVWLAVYEFRMTNGRMRRLEPNSGRSAPFRAHAASLGLVLR